MCTEPTWCTRYCPLNTGSYFLLYTSMPSSRFLVPFHSSFLSNFVFLFPSFYIYPYPLLLSLMHFSSFCFLLLAFLPFLLVYYGICFILPTSFPLLSPLGALMPEDLKVINHVTSNQSRAERHTINIRNITVIAHSTSQTLCFSHSEK